MSVFWCFLYCESLAHSRTKDLAGGDDSEKSDVDSALEEGISLIAETSDFQSIRTFRKHSAEIQHN